MNLQLGWDKLTQDLVVGLYNHHLEFILKVFFRNFSLILTIFRRI